MARDEDGAFNFVVDLAERYISQPAQEYLGGLTSGGGDELIAALRAPIRAAQEQGVGLNPMTWAPAVKEAILAPSSVVGAPFGLATREAQGAYERELADIRQDQRGFRERNPLGSTALNITGGIAQGAGISKALPSLSALLSSSVKASPVLAGGALGAGQGAVSGFLEGEVGFGERAKRAVDTAYGAGLFSSLLGAAGKYFGPSDSLQEEGQKMVLKSLGIGKSDYNKALKSIAGAFDAKSGQVSLEESLERLSKQGMIDESIITQPKQYLSKLSSKKREIGTDVQKIVDFVDKQGLSPDIDLKTFARTIDKPGRYTGTTSDTMEGQVTKELKSLMSKIGQAGVGGSGPLSIAQDQKKKLYRGLKSFYNKNAASTAETTSASVQASLASDLKSYIEREATDVLDFMVKQKDPEALDLAKELGKKYGVSTKDAVRKVNELYGDVESVLPFAYENLIKSKTDTWLHSRIVPGLRTSGGFGVPMILGGLAAATGNPAVGLPIMGLAAGAGGVLTSPLGAYRTGEALKALGGALDTLPAGWTRGLLSSKVAGIETDE